MDVSMCDYQDTENEDFLYVLMERKEEGVIKEVTTINALHFAHYDYKDERKGVLLSGCIMLYSNNTIYNEDNVAPLCSNFPCPFFFSHSVFCSSVLLRPICTAGSVRLLDSKVTSPNE